MRGNGEGYGGGRSLIFNGHVDVVPAGDPANWRSGDRFSGVSTAIGSWGRGATDMKGGLVAQAFAARALARAGVRLKGDLILEAVVGEEVMDHEAGVSATVNAATAPMLPSCREPSGPPQALSVVPVSPGLGGSR